MYNITLSSESCITDRYDWLAQAVSLTYSEIRLQISFTHETEILAQLGL